MQSSKLILLNIVCVCIIAIIVLVILYLFPPGNDILQKSNKLSSIDLTSESTLLLSMESLSKDLQKLGSVIEKLNESLYLNDRERDFTHAEEDVSKIRVEPLISRLETLIENLIETIHMSAPIAERNISLRPVFEGLAANGQRKIGVVWQSKESAINSIYMSTYSQVLNKLGIPNSISGSRGLTVEWYYPDGHIRFVDGYVAYIESNMWK
jgi:hypothetical protein